MIWPVAKEIGWTEIGEKFTRFVLFESSWCNIFVHKLNAPNWHEDCHDHPWSFLAILLWRGYYEIISPSKHINRRYPGQILYRRAECIHNIVTKGTSWSLVITGPKRRKWSLKSC